MTNYEHRPEYEIRQLELLSKMVKGTPEEELTRLARTFADSWQGESIYNPEDPINAALFRFGSDVTRRYEPIANIREHWGDTFGNKGLLRRARRTHSKIRIQLIPILLNQLEELTHRATGHT